MTSATNATVTTGGVTTTRHKHPVSPLRAYRAILMHGIRSQLMSMGIFYGIYLACAWILPLIILVTMVPIEQQSTGTTDIVVASIIYAIITSIIVMRTDFKLLVQFGFSRTQIFSFAVMKTVINSAIMAILTTFLEWILPFVVISGHNVRLQLLGVGMYADGKFIVSHRMASDHYGMILILCFFLFFMASALGVLLSILLDQLSSTGKLILAACCIVIPIIAFEIHSYVLSEHMRNQFSAFFRTIAGIDFPYFHAGPIMITMLVITMIFFFTTFLLNRRREVKRVNA